MAIPVKVRNRLLADSGGICAICEKRLIVNHGEICHIEAQSPGGTRYNEYLSKEKIDSYDNLIYLCPICHKDIDINQKNSYPVNRLKNIKDNHIKKIQNIFKRPTNDYKNYYDKTFEYLNSSNFIEWASLFYSGFSIESNIYNDIINYKNYIDIYQLTSDNNLNNLRIDISLLIKKFLGYSGLILIEVNSNLVGNRFYDRFCYNPNYNLDLELYELIKEKILIIFNSLVLNINALLFQLEQKIGFYHQKKLEFKFSKDNFIFDKGCFVETENYEDLSKTLSILENNEVEIYIKENYLDGIDWCNNYN